MFGKEVVYRLPSLYLGTEEVEVEGNKRGGEGESQGEQQQ